MSPAILKSLDEFFKTGTRMRCSVCGEIYENVHKDLPGGAVIRKDTLETFELNWDDCGKCMAYKGLRGTLVELN